MICSAFIQSKLCLGLLFTSSPTPSSPSPLSAPSWSTAMLWWSPTQSELSKCSYRPCFFDCLKIPTCTETSQFDFILNFKTILDLRVEAIVKIGWIFKDFLRFSKISQILLFWTLHLISMHIGNMDSVIKLPQQRTDFVSQNWKWLATFNITCDPCNDFAAVWDSIDAVCANL